MLRGLDKVIKNLNKQIKIIEGKTEAGLILAVAYVRRDMGEGGTPPLIPFEWGNLEGSWFRDPHKTKTGKVWIRCGFSAEYAAFVHEMIGTSERPINWSRPGSGPKFFEAALKRNTKKIFEIIRDNAEIPK